MSVEITITGAEMAQEEVQQYIDYLQEKTGRQLSRLNIDVDGEYVDLRYTLSKVPFERIRRITGYLVGTMDRWNDAKTAEEADRVKQSLSQSPMEQVVGL